MSLLYFPDHMAMAAKLSPDLKAGTQALNLIPNTLENKMYWAVQATEHSFSTSAAVWS